jgi:hypothetical protein
MKTKFFIILSLLITTGFSPVFSAEDMKEDTSDGCGLGWKVISKRSIFGTSVRATTNYVIPPSFGMTTGTMDCEKHNIVKKDKIKMYFTEANFDNIIAEMAEGKGEYLHQYASILGCNPGIFSKFAQMNYRSLVSTTPGRLLSKILNKVKNSPQLNANCQSI